MKTLILLFGILILFSSCIREFRKPVVNTSHYGQTSKEDSTKVSILSEVEIFNNLPAPVILFSENSTFGYQSAIVMDGEGKLTVFGDLTLLGNSIAKNYNVGDTLKHKR